MPRRINVQVDAYGVNREEIHNLIFDAVQRSCGTVIESGYETGRSFFGMWSTWFIIPSESHTDENHEHLQEILAQIYAAHSSEIRGFRTIWEGDRQQKMAKEVELSMKRFGEASSNLGSEWFKHLQDQDDENADFCCFCGLKIEEIDHLYGRVSERKGNKIHTYCKVIEVGVVPECPIAQSVSPKPTTNLCVQAYSVGNDTCENLVCQIGQSVRLLREKGLMPWDGYIPKSSRNNEQES